MPYTSMIFDNYEWHRLDAPSEFVLGEITGEEVYAALTKGAEAKRYSGWVTSFASVSSKLQYNFREFSSDIYHQELISCWGRTPDELYIAGTPRKQFRWGVGAYFESGDCWPKKRLSRNVNLEGRWSKDHDGMTSHFECGPDIPSKVHIVAVLVKLAVDEATMIAELRDFISPDFKQIEPEPKPAVDLETLHRIFSGRD